MQRWVSPVDLDVNAIREAQQFDLHKASHYGSARLNVNCIDSRQVKITPRKCVRENAPVVSTGGKSALPIGKKKKEREKRGNHVKQGISLLFNSDRGNHV